jgi:hypothetical protein
MTLITNLDLEVNKMYCFEDGVNELIIANMIRGIKSGDIFPVVPVLLRAKGEYALINGCVPLREEDNQRTREGGHHRAYAHYKSQKPLRVEVYTLEELEGFFLFSESNIPLENLALFRDEYMYRGLVQTDTNYRRNHHQDILNI